MLLPSALSCGYTTVQPEPQRPSRPKLPSFERYDPCRRSNSPVYGLIASCRALQSMLGDRFTPSPAPSPSIDATLRARPFASPFGEPSPPPTLPPIPRGNNKRRRDDFDDDIEDKQRNFRRTEEHNDMFATPKRRRIIPLNMPPGLMPSDFEALAESSLPTIRTPRASRYYRQIDLPMDQDIPPPLESEQSANDWTENDDRMLVETVLSKLNLSAREWNDCARRLGKDKDSLDHRWRLLLGEGNIGLRRGVGRMGRVDLDLISWQ